MRFIKRFALIVALLVMLVPDGVAMAQSSSDYLDLVKTRCDATKQLVDQQRRSDLVARINKGRAYQIIIDQQSAFSLRLRNNKVSADTFDHEQAALQEGVNSFRTAYDRYDDSMASLLNIDCKSKPQDFAQQLVVARSLRQIIGNVVADTDTELARYRQDVTNFKQEIDRLGGKVTGAAQ